MIPLSKNQLVFPTEKIQQMVETVKSTDAKIVVSRSIPCPVLDPLAYMNSVSINNGMRIFWEQPHTGFSFVGLNFVLEIKLDENYQFHNAKREMALILENSVFPEGEQGPIFIGGHAFNIDSQSENNDIWQEYPHGYYVIPECLLTIKQKKATLTISQLIKENDSAESIDNKFTELINHYQCEPTIVQPSKNNGTVSEYIPFPEREKYLTLINSVLDSISAGVVDKVVISRSLQVNLNKEIDIISALSSLRRNYPECVIFMFDLLDKGLFFGASPEQLIQRRGVGISTFALAGTIMRGGNSKEDQLLTHKLLTDEKEQAEHRFVIDQIRKRLKPIVTTLDIQKEPTIMQLNNVQHLHTWISGQLKDDSNVFDLVQVLHPTSAVAGIPNDKAVQIIAELEQNDRGWYSGPIGWMDTKGDGEFYVALRSALVKQNNVHVFAGGGIVAGSIPENEWTETELKMMPIISTINGES